MKETDDNIVVINEMSKGAEETDDNMVAEVTIAKEIDFNINKEIKWE